MGVRGFLQLVVTQATMLRRNTGWWISSIMMAVLSMAVFGWLFNPDTQPFDLALVDEDRTESSQALVRAASSEAWATALPRCRSSTITLTSSASAT